MTRKDYWREYHKTTGANTTLRTEISAGNR